jgi:hypothetical protein
VIVLALGLAGIALAQTDVATGLRREWPKTDFSRRTVELAEITSGGPPKDGIPAIDRPRFVAPSEAARWLQGDEPVIALRIAGDTRAYPLQILTFHEIVNDTVGGTPVAVTFCPLCNASIVFERRAGERVLDFGTTGRLRKSDLVMYDRQTESWWQQFTGAGIVGHYAGTRLATRPAEVVAFDEFRTAYPGGKVLARETGFSRPYGSNPYRGYDRVGQNPFLFSDPVDPRLPAMERVLGVSHGDVHRVYPLSVLAATPVINDTFGGRPIVILSRPGMRSALDAERIAASRTIPAAAAFERTVGGRVLGFEARDGRLLDRETGSEWNLFGEATSGPLSGSRLTPVAGGVHFAFAWLAFRPDSDVYRGDRR